ncbi:hypothetical protein THASP1DRAFT_31571 [Thamnocephalis sphaerospora]|uniref:Uncharacterized protein n=1 Tax=Thamnocephalis sphaerospora TaxID=78915 RepID=A0A4P9XML4_9FUNG|nr:hypothetical protein THASP1DRAFT_31571 [Thamnocephalis sphaerospora]|eukprot:RKP06621.1 hypothetical protein THASP1DRAFT_31571 [Thamnocephalis sphaerospora]
MSDATRSSGTPSDKRAGKAPALATDDDHPSVYGRQPPKAADHSAEHGAASLAERVARSAQGLWHSALGSGGGTVEEGLRAGQPAARGAQGKRFDGGQTSDGLMRAHAAGWEAARGAASAEQRGESSLAAAPALSATADSRRQGVGSIWRDHPATQAATDAHSAEADWAQWSSPPSSSLPSVPLAAAAAAPALGVHPPRESAALAYEDASTSLHVGRALETPAGSMNRQHSWHDVPAAEMAAMDDGAMVRQFLSSGSFDASYATAVYEDDIRDVVVQPVGHIAGMSRDWVQSFCQRWQQQRQQGQTSLLSPPEAYLARLLEAIEREHGQLDQAALDADVLAYLDAHHYTDQVYGDDLLPPNVAQDQTMLRQLLRDLSASTPSHVEPDQDGELRRRRALDRLRTLQRHLAGV